MLGQIKERAKVRENVLYIKGNYEGVLLGTEQGEIVEKALAPPGVGSIWIKNLVEKFTGKAGRVIPTTLVLAANDKKYLKVLFDDGKGELMGDISEKGENSINYETGELKAKFKFMETRTSKAEILVTFGYEI
jgi:hypothetical protein